MALLRFAATVGLFTMGSRVLGFLRDILIARYLGASSAGVAFFVAFKLPNLFRRLFAEGAFAAAFVPMFARRLEGEGRGEAEAFARRAWKAAAGRRRWPSPSRRWRSSCGRCWRSPWRRRSPCRG